MASIAVYIRFIFCQLVIRRETGHTVRQAAALSVAYVANLDGVTQWITGVIGSIIKGRAPFRFPVVIDRQTFVPAEIVVRFFFQFFQGAVRRRRVRVFHPLRGLFHLVLVLLKGVVVYGLRGGMRGDGRVVDALAVFDVVSVHVRDKRARGRTARCAGVRIRYHVLFPGLLELGFGYPFFRLGFDHILAFQRHRVVGVSGDSHLVQQLFVILTSDLFVMLHRHVRLSHFRWQVRPGVHLLRVGYRPQLVRGLVKYREFPVDEIGGLFDLHRHFLGGIRYLDKRVVVLSGYNARVLLLVVIFTHLERLGSRLCVVFPQGLGVSEARYHVNVVGLVRLRSAFHLHTACFFFAP